MSLRILHIIPNLRKGGAERMALEICKGLALVDGNEVLLIVLNDENASRNLYPSINIKSVPASISLSVIGKNVFNVASLQKEIEAFEPHIIHSHLYMAELVSRSCYYPKAKWFSHTHDNMPAFENFSLKTIFKKALFIRYYEKRFLLSRYKKNGGNTFIAISQSTQQYFKKVAKGFPVFFLPNGIDYSRFYATEKNSSERLRLISIGSLVENKNHTFLVDVCNLLLENGVDAELHILGDGPLKSFLENKIFSRKLSNKIFLHGNVEHVERFLWNADIYIHSAKSEALGLTLIEAMAAGLPVVTLDGIGNRDLIEEGKNGYMVFNAQPHLMANKIMELWSNKVLYKIMSDYAKNFAKKYDIKPYITNLLHIYNNS